MCYSSETIHFQRNLFLTTNCYTLYLRKAIVGTLTYRGSKGSNDAVSKSDNAGSIRKESDFSDDTFNFGESEATEEEAEFLSSNVEVDDDEIKIDVKVEDMLGDLSWYFDDSNKKTRKGRSETAKSEQEKEKKEQDEENGSDD